MKEDGFTPRERWLAVLNHRKPDRVPMDYWATGEVTSRLMKHLGCSTSKEVFEKLHIDAVFEVSPEYIGSPIPENSDLYDCHYRNVKHETGIYSECVYHPLAKYKTVSEIKKNFEWPSVDIFDYSVIPEKIEVYDNYPIRGGGSEPFLTYKNLRGMRQSYLDLYMHSDIVHYCLDKLFDFYYDNTNLIYDQAPGKVLLSYVAEDFGSQNGLLVSPAHIQEYFLSRMKRMMYLAHNNGVYVFFHSDGSIKKIIPDMIRAGIDILNPIQWRCKDMNREVLKDEFGDKVVFHGAMDNQYTLAFGTQNDVRQEVRDNLRIMGKEGGYILAPCHNIQPITPTQNILVMYEEGYKQGI